MAEKQKRPPAVKLVTPRGISAWPKLDEPDMKFAKNGVGVYSIKWRGDSSDAEVQKIVALIEKEHAAALALAQTEIKEKLDEATTGKDKKKFKEALAKLELADSPVKVVADDEGNDTDEIELFFKMPEKVKGKGDKVFELKPIVESASGKKIDPKKTSIWGGSVVRVSAELRPYYNAATNSAGVSLRLVAVRVIELVSAGSNRDTGFGDGEEGYDGPEAGDDEQKSDGPDGADTSTSTPDF